MDFEEPTEPHYMMLCIEYRTDDFPEVPQRAHFQVIDHSPHYPLVVELLEMFEDTAISHSLTRLDWPAPPPAPTHWPEHHQKQ